MRVDLDELEALEKEATPGPLVASPGYYCGYTVCHNSHEERAAVYNRKGNMLHADALLFAATRNALPALIAELRAARECTYILKWASDCDALRNEDEDMADLAVEKLAAYAATKGDG